jgi:hypothetical protein
MNDEKDCQGNGQKLFRIVTTVNKRFYTSDNMNQYNVNNKGDEYLSSAEVALNKAIPWSQMVDPSIINSTYNHLICESILFDHRNEFQAHVRHELFMKKVPLGGLQDIIFLLKNDKNLDFIQDGYQKEQLKLDLPFRETKLIENEINIGNTRTFLNNQNIDCLRNGFLISDSEIAHVNDILNSLNAIKKRYFLLKDLNQHCNDKEGGDNETLPTERLKNEVSILGTILFKDAFWRAFYFIVDEAIFYNPKNQIIFETISFLFNNFLSTRKQDVVEQLRKEGNLEFVGGEDYITQLISNSLSSQEIRFVEGSIQMNKSPVFLNNKGTYCLSK